MVRNTPYGAGADDKTKAAADAAIAYLKAGKPIFAKPVKDNKGNVVLPAAPYDNYSDALNQMTYLVEGVVGSTT
jgi:simple sugar transport system substrate-binding protein